MLARLVQAEAKGNPITSIELQDGSIGYTSKAINEAFLSCYRELYKAPIQLAEEVYDIYLDRMQLPQLPREERLELGGPITPEEIGGMIKGLANGKKIGRASCGKECRL